MKTHLIILIILEAISLSPEIYAQKDASYAILFQGDTLYGKIKTDVSGHAKLKIGNGKESLKYRPDELLGYYDAKKDKVFITIDPEDDNHGPWLYERKADGIIKMYCYIFDGVSGGRTPFYYVEKENSVLKRVLKGSLASIKKEKDILRGFMSDNEDLLAEIKRSGWNEKNVLHLVNLYNLWYAAGNNEKKIGQD